MGRRQPVIFFYPSGYMYSMVLLNRVPVYFFKIKSQRKRLFFSLNRMLSIKCSISFSKNPRCDFGRWRARSEANKIRNTFFLICRMEDRQKKKLRIRVQMVLTGKVNIEVTSIWIISPKYFPSKMRFYTSNYPENCLKFTFHATSIDMGKAIW